MDESPSIKSYLVATLGVAVATGLLWLLRDYLGNAHTGLVYLLVVAGAAAAGGTRPGLMAALLCFLAWDFFFLPPYFTFIIADPRDWILLFAFLVIGILVGHMTGRIRMREAEAVAREHDMAALYHATQAVTTHPDLHEALDSIVVQITLSTDADPCAILEMAEDEVLRPLAQRGTLDVLEETQTRALCRWAVEQAKAVGLGPAPAGLSSEETPWPVSVAHTEARREAGGRPDVFLPLITRERAFGVLYARPRTGLPFSDRSARLLVAFASQAASFLERRQLQDEATRVASQKEAERLKTVLFSSLSHNLKTPLASLKAALSSLWAEDIEWDRDQVREGLSIMAEDLDRLTLHIENLLNLAQLESGSWLPQREWVEVRELVATALRFLSEREYRRVRLVGFDDGAGVEVDTVQMAQVIRHLVENALAYSPHGTTVEISARAAPGLLELFVDDEGPGIPAADRDQVFTKFYRGRAATMGAVRGTGLGLSICREIVQAHGGIIQAEDSPRGGARLHVTLPNEVASPRVEHALKSGDRT